MPPIPGPKVRLQRRLNRACHAFNLGSDPFPAFWAHFLIDADLHGPVVDVQLGSSPHGEPVVAISLTSARLLKSVMREPEFEGR